MEHILNRKLLLTLTTLAYTFNVSAAHATNITDDESFSSRAWSTVKSGAFYATGFVASATVYETERETFLHAKNQAVQYGCETGLFLADQASKGYKTSVSLLSSAYNWGYDTYMPYHPTVCHVTSEAMRLGTEGITALHQTITEHPYVSLGVAVTFAASIGIAYFYGKNKASQASKLMEEKEAAALLEKRRVEERNATLLEEIKALREKKAPNTSVVTKANPTATSDNKGTITSSPTVSPNVQGGSVTFNLVLPNTTSRVFSQDPIPTGSPNHSIKLED